MADEIQKPKSEPIVLEKISKKGGIVKTYAEDMAKVIEKNEGGVIKKIIHEQEEHEAIKKNLSPESKRNKLFMLVSVLLIFLAVILFASLVAIKNQSSTTAVAPQFTPLVFTDKAEYKEIAGLSKSQITQTILNEINSTGVKNGGVEGVYLTENKKIIGLRRLGVLLGMNLPADQMTFVNDNYLLGIFNEGTQKDLFILLKTRSFLDVFPTMKTWESKMFSDLDGLFGITINADTSYLLTKNFEDGIVGNKNARILKDKNGKTILEYVFANDTSVIITDSDQTAQEVMLRLASGQIKK